MKRLLLLCMIILSVACDNETRSLSSLAEPVEENEDHRNPPRSPDEFIDSRLFICSKLDFAQMKVPADLTDIEMNLFALGLNISASFEGRSGWKNITNNFDGMGLSLGLLNQTLGTASLQPLLVRMIEKHEAVMKTHYTAANYTSIKTMALDWKKATGFVVQSISHEELFAPDDMPLSDLDMGEVFQIQGAAENKSVTWAKQTIYTDAAGKTFKTDWKSQLQNMAGSPEYRDIQFAAARKLHNKAAGYLDSFGLTEVRSYLFMFDIVVQNGGLHQKNFDDYRTFIAKNPNATEKQKLQAILESRLVQVRSQFRTDVRSRKEGLINGKGRVHQTDRNFEKEYCYQSSEVIE
jgi:hypothetical protein